MMCQGCDYELHDAIIMQDYENLYYATSIDKEYYHTGHFVVLMVDSNGEIVVW